ncbi:hypothetical protein DFJ74DRAFT_658591 [Hyaloraphidium curvatum]|nr:hypothetical protein DFJ74DRAFT_658591 [Hyaloraphidium curvatum]
MVRSPDVTAEFSVEPFPRTSTAPDKGSKHPLRHSTRSSRASSAKQTPSIARTMPHDAPSSATPALSPPALAFLRDARRRMVRHHGDPAHSAVEVDDHQKRMFSLLGIGPYGSFLPFANSPRWPPPVKHAPVTTDAAAVCGAESVVPIGSWPEDLWPELMKHMDHAALATLARASRHLCALASAELYGRTVRFSLAELRIRRRILDEDGAVYDEGADEYGSECRSRFHFWNLGRRHHSLAQDKDEAKIALGEAAALVEARAGSKLWIREARGWIAENWPQA